MKKINTNWAYWWLYISFVLTKSLEQPVLSHSDVSDSLKSYDFVSTHFRLSAIHADGVMPFTFLNNRLK